MVTWADGSQAGFEDVSSDGDAPGRGVLDGRYELGPLLRFDGVCRVHQAFDLELQRHVGVSIRPLPAEQRHQVRALAQESRRLARLRHPNIQAALDVGFHRGRLYCTQPLTDALSLSDWLAEDRPWSQVLGAMRQVAEGLMAAHDAGVLHRDVRPEHATIDARGRVRITRFGLARDTPSTQDTDDSDTTGSRSLPSIGSTQPYLAPEQFEGTATAASDQFAFCTALFEALSGVQPWVAQERGLRPGASDRVVVEPLRARRVPRWLCNVLRRGLAHDPESRFVSMHALCAALDRAPRKRALVLGIVAAGLGALTVGRSVSVQPCEVPPSMDAAWTDEARAALVDTLGGAGASSVLVETVDDGVETWHTTVQRGCVARRRGAIDTELLDLRLRCLDQTAARLDYALEQIGRRPYSTRRIAAALTPAVRVDRCEDDDALIDWARDLQGTSVDLDLYGEIERGVDRAYVQLNLGDEVASFETLELLYRAHGVRVDAGRAGARVAAQYATALSRQGRFAQAAAVVRDAMQRLGSDERVTFSAAELRGALSVALSADPARAPEAQHLAEQSLAVLRARAHVSMVASVLAAKARAAAFSGDRVAAYGAVQELDALVAESDAAVWEGYERNRIEAIVLGAEIRARLGRHEESAQRYQEAISELRMVGTYPRVLAVALHNAGNQRSRAGQSGAAAMVEEAAGLKQGFGDRVGAAESWMTAGTLHLREGRRTRAIEAYREALVVLPEGPHPRRFEMLYNLGLAQQADGDPGAARSTFEQARRAAADAGLEATELQFNVEVALLQLLAGESPEDARHALASVRQIERDEFSAYTRAEVELVACQLFESSDPRRAREALERAQPLVQEARDEGLRDAMRACRSRIRKG